MSGALSTALQWLSARFRLWRSGLAVLLAFSTAPRSPAVAQGNDVRDLPVRFVTPVGAPSHFTAVVLSGDGGYAKLVTTLAEGLAAHGVGAVLFNSREWLSPKKTPQQSAEAVVRVLRAAMARYHADSIVLVGYSRGADMAPFVANRLPADLRAVLGGVSMFGLAPNANFEFHLIDLVKDTERDSDIPVLPELLRLKGVPMSCVYGSDEKASGCRGVPPSLMRVEERSGGHHFEGADATLSDVVLRLISEAR